MGKEIERKFLVTGEGWRAMATGENFRQGFLSTEKERTVRVRVAGRKGTLTIKGKSNGISRAEYEYEIPVGDAEKLLDELCHRPIIEKVRHTLEFGGKTWEVDVFAGENLGLVVAEVELEDENQSVELPDWVGQDVSDDPRYFNANLVSHPYSRW